MSETITIRPMKKSDEAAWRQLWAGYVEFYRATVSAEITAHTWKRILDPASPVSGHVAVIDGEVAGFEIHVLHEATWTKTPVCYLEDLYVDPRWRGRGLGRALIARLVGEGKREGWSRLYWHTESGNPARNLYDEFVAADDFVRYRMFL